MRLVIDGRMLGWTGIGRYTGRLLEQLEELNQTDEIIVLMLKGDEELWKPTKPNFRRSIVSARPYGFTEQWELPRVLRRLKPDLVHFPHFTVPLVYNAPYVVTVHDLTLVDYKNVRGTGLQKWLYEIKYVASRLVLRHAVVHARLVLAPTQYTKDQLASRFRLAPARLSATLLGVDPLSTTPVAPAISAPYLLSIGNSYPYKNLDRLVDAFAASTFRTRGGKLVLGGQADYFGQQLRERVIALGLDNAVLFPGRVSDAQLAGLYQQATLYVYPSLSEGFGLQALEAMEYGVPVLAANASCLPEVCGEAAVYFNPNDTTSLIAKIDEFATDSAQREKLVTAGHQRVTRFSWKAMAEQTLAAYRVAIKKTGA